MNLTNERFQLGMATEWWVTHRDVKPIRGAIIRAFLDHWLPVVEGAIRANKRSGHSPANWDQLAGALDRNFASLWRAKNGKVKLSWYDAELLAETLGLRIEQMTPTRRQWLPAATRYVCGSEVSDRDATAYALYRMSGAKKFNPHFDALALEQVREALPGFLDADGVANAVAQVAERVGQALQAADQH
ncbi:MAG: hypothetical protein KDB14_01760 [Planctomycetales bacterium]|nr:hypothetical protein [Planctomycetales bacterium]